MKLFFPKHIFLILKIVFSFFLLFFLIKLILYHYHLIIDPFQAEYREGASITMTSALIKGLNPYALENQPQYTNDYGILYSLFVYPFAKCFGVTLLVHRWVNAFLIGLSCLFLIFVMQRLEIPLLLSLSGALLFYASLLFPRTTTACATPSPLGVLLFLLSVFLPWLDRYSWRSIFWSVFLGLLAYFTKPYFILCIPLIGSYIFFFVSKKKGLWIAGLSLLFFVLSLFAAGKIFECYFNNCYFIHTNATPLSPEHLNRQIDWYLKLHKPLLMLLVAGLAAIFFRNLKNGAQTIRPLGKALKEFLSKIHINQFDRPLIDLPCPLTFYCAVIVWIVLILSLGKHIGALLWYFFHLLSPFLIVYALWILSRFSFWPIGVLPFLVWNLSVITVDHDYQRLTADTAVWSELKKQISNYNNILNSPIVAAFLVEQNKPIFDNGLSEYFKIGGYRYSFNKRFFKPDGRIIHRYYQYLNEIKQMVRTKQFDLILLTEGYAPFAPVELPNYYQYLGTVKLSLPHCFLDFNVTIWQSK